MNHRQSIITLFIAAIGYVLLFLINYIWANSLPPETFGDLSILLNFFSLIALFGVFGTDDTVLRFIPKYIKENNLLTIKTYFLWNRKLLKLLTILLTIFFFVIMLIMLILSYYSKFELIEIHPLIFSFWLIPINVYLLWLNGVLKAFNLVNVSLFLNQIFVFVLQIVLIFALFQYIGNISLVPILTVIGLSQFIVVLISYFLIQQRYKTFFSDTRATTKTEKWNKYAKIILMNNFVIFFANSCSLFLLEIFGKDEVQVGVFAAIIIITRSLFIIDSSIRSLFIPLFVINHKDKIVLNKLISRVNVIKAISLFVVASIIMIFSKDILNLFNPQFHIYFKALFIVIVIETLGKLLSTYSSLLKFTGYQKLGLFSNITYLSVTLLLGIILIPFFQIYGAVIASSVGIFSSYVLDYILYRKFSILS